jgi:hypothetical protein
MKRAFVDPVTGVLKAYGYVATNAPGDIAIPVTDAFALTPGLWRWDGTQFVPFTPPPTPAQLDHKAAKDALDAVATGGLLEIQAALAALRKVLGV